MYMCTCTVEVLLNVLTLIATVYGAYYGGVDLTYPGLQAPAPRAPSTSLEPRDIPPSNRTHPPAALP